MLSSKRDIRMAGVMFRRQTQGTGLQFKAHQLRLPVPRGGMQLTWSGRQ